jgi:hypothetical protein
MVDNRIAFRSVILPLIDVSEFMPRLRMESLCGSKFTEIEPVADAKALGGSIPNRCVEMFMDPVEPETVKGTSPETDGGKVL